MKANDTLALSFGWNAETFARTKKLQPLDKYLTPPKAKTPDSGANDVKRMFDRMIAKQGGADGTR